MNEGHVCKVGYSPTNCVRQWTTVHVLQFVTVCQNEQLKAQQVKSIPPCHKWASGALRPIHEAGTMSIKEGEEIILTPCIQFLDTIPKCSTSNTGHHTSSDDDKKGPKMSATLAQA